MEFSVGMKIPAAIILPGSWPGFPAESKVPGGIMVAGKSCQDSCQEAKFPATIMQSKK